MLSAAAGEGAPLILILGGLTGWARWEPHVEPLCLSRQVVRLQLLNVQYGLENRDLPADYSVKTESRALAKALDELGLGAPVDVADWSSGALVSLDFALDHAGRVRTLTLIEPPAFWVLRALGTSDTEARRVEAMVRTLLGDLSEDQLERFVSAVGLCPPGESSRRFPSGRNGVSTGARCVTLAQWRSTATIRGG